MEENTTPVWFIYNVRILYVVQGTLIDGTEFDSSYSRGAPSKFAPSQVSSGQVAPYSLFLKFSRLLKFCPGHSGMDRSNAAYA